MHRDRICLNAKERICLSAKETEFALCKRDQVSDDLIYQTTAKVAEAQGDRGRVHCESERDQVE